MVVTCPATLQLTYYRGGRRRRLLIALDTEGQPTVGLHIDPQQWSGWHGGWRNLVLGGFVVRVHYSGRNHLARAYIFDRVELYVYQFWQGGGYIRCYATMITVLLTQGQLGDAMSPWEFL